MKDEGAPGIARLQPGANLNPLRVFPNGRDGKWSSRGYLPHFESAQAIQHITFRLADSLPQEAIQRMESELKRLPEREQPLERRKRIEELLDAGSGSCLLRNPSAAALVQDSLLCFDRQRYRLFAWVIMPNHVHVLVQGIAPWTVAKAVAGWKSWTGRRISEMANEELARLEPGDPRRRVWYREYWDRFVRNERHFQNVVAYIDENPVKAGLVKAPMDWEWGSARLSLR